MSTGTERYVERIAEAAWDAVVVELIAKSGVVVDPKLAALLVSTLEAGASQALRDLMIRLEVVDVPLFMEKIGWTP